MGLKLDQVVPWGRSLPEYLRMFALTPDDLRRSILDCGAGPASFNAELQQQRPGVGQEILGTVISCDPIYQFSAAQIEQRVRETHPVIVEGVRANREAYCWHQVSSPEALGEMRLRAMQGFLQDFPEGFSTGRYCVGELPQLPFQTGQFSLALCGHLLFTYSDALDLAFHQAALQELCRVASEVRIFPLLNLSGELSPWLEPVVEALMQQGFHCQIQTTDYEFQKGGNQLLTVTQGVSRPLIPSPLLPPK